MLENIGNTTTHLAMDLLRRNLAGRTLSRFRHVRQNGLATPHRTLSSYGRLEAERVKQF